jgi:hypothetical protein
MLTLKHLALIAALALPATPAKADTETCVLLGQLAEQVMLNRQAGVPLSASLGVVPDEDTAYAALLRSITLSAYDTPRWHTPSMQRRAAEDHRDMAEQACFRAAQNG